MPSPPGADIHTFTNTHWTPTSPVVSRAGNETDSLWVHEPSRICTVYTLNLNLRFWINFHINCETEVEDFLFFCTCMSDFSNTILSPLNCQCTFVKYHLAIFVWICLWILYLHWSMYITFHQHHTQSCSNNSFKFSLIWECYFILCSGYFLRKQNSWVTILSIQYFRNNIPLIYELYCFWWGI